MGLNDTKSNRSTLPFLAIALAFALPANASSPEDDARAEELFKDAKALMAAGQIDQACPKFELAKHIGAGGGAALALALCHESEGRIATALAEFREALALAVSAKRSDRVELAQARIAHLEQTVSTLIVVAPIGTELQVNGAPWDPTHSGVAIPLDPGNYVVRADDGRNNAWEATVHIGSERTAQRLEVPDLQGRLTHAIATSKRAPTDTSSEQSAHAMDGRRVVALSAIGLGVASLSASAYFGLRAMSARNTATCGDHVCPGQSPLYGRAHSMATAATATAILGLAGIGTGVLLLIARHRDSGTKEEATRLVPQVDVHAGGIAIVGTF